MSDPHSILFDVLEAFAIWEDDEPEPTIDVGDEAVLIGRAIGRLWSCGQKLPNDLRADVLHHIRHHERQHTLNTLSTYAQAARIVKCRINETKGV